MLQCKVVQTLASFHLTEYEVTEWAADLNLLLAEYLGVGVGVGVGALRGNATPRFVYSINLDLSPFRLSE